MIESYKYLKQDSGDAIVALLAQIAQKIQVNDTYGNIASIASSYPSPFKPTLAALRVNQLWFTALGLCVLSTVVTMLAKQWLYEYTVGLTYAGDFAYGRRARKQIQEQVNKLTQKLQRLQDERLHLQQQSSRPGQELAMQQIQRLRQQPTLRIDCRREREEKRERRLQQKKDSLQRDLDRLKEQPAHSLRHQVRLRQHRFEGLLRWNVPKIIACLPLMLHLAVLLFAIGLAILVWELDGSSARIITTLTSLTFIAYMLTTILSSFKTSCPYKTPLSHLIHNVGFALKIIQAYTYIGKPFHGVLMALRFSKNGGRLRRSEEEEVEDRVKDLDIKSLVWLQQNTQDMAVALDATHALGKIFGDSTHTEEPQARRQSVSSLDSQSTLSTLDPDFLE